MTLDLGIARGVDAQSTGEPGQRTFRLRIQGAGAGWASLKVEKEHLRALSLALRQVLSQLRYEQEPQGESAGDFSGAAEPDFSVGLMGIGFDSSQRTVVLQVHELGTAEEEEPALRVRLALNHCASLAVQIDEIIARGRPSCPLCGSPLDRGGHKCIRSNGHSDQPIPEADAEEES